MTSNDVEAAREFQTERDNEAKAKAQREIEESEAATETLSKPTQELLNVDIQIDRDIENDSEAELLDLGFVDLTINISGKDTISRFLKQQGYVHAQRNLNNKRYSVYKLKSLVTSQKKISS